MSQRLRRAWQQRGPLARLLWPLSQLYRLLAALRRQLYRTGWLRSTRLPVPVIVVGNVIAGGAGKTPVTLAVVHHLQAAGWQPGVISRGYGRSTSDCRAVLAGSDAAEVGDEPLLIARASGAPVFVARRRADAARTLLAAHPATDVLVCDDGLQHLALARDVEICVFNDAGVGNGWLLPAGPLREPWPRPVDLIVDAGQLAAGSAPRFAMQRTLAPYAIDREGSRTPLQALRGRRLHALAAIARPEDFFAQLRAQGLQPQTEQPLPDHDDLRGWQPPADAATVVLCTEKDAVKLWPRHPQVLAVPLQVRIDPGFFTALDARLASLSFPATPRTRHGPETA